MEAHAFSDSKYLWKAGVSGFSAGSEFRCLSSLWFKRRFRQGRERGSVTEKSRGHFSRMAAVAVVPKGYGFEGALSKSGGKPEGGDDVLSSRDVVLETSPRHRQSRPTAAISE